MGTPTTWHGTPDGRANGTSLYSLTTDKCESGSESDTSEGGATTFEDKLSFTLLEQIDQILAHAVVASFIHHNRHPDQNPLMLALGLSGVPEGTTWVGGGEVVALLYNCSTDLALRVEPLAWLDCMSQRLDSRGIFVMWIILHHRLFL